VQAVRTCLMFVGEQHGRAREAVDFYVSIFSDGRLDSMETYGPDDEEAEGTVKLSKFSLAGRDFMAMDSGREHHFTFTPAMSLFVDCDRRDELDALHSKLLEGGLELMPLAEYPFSPRFGWVQDRFGVSWQLNLVAV
jgi:predicted 3-demethylubiquinone-9 3-methyltransferase (glyoxalase superfamily)